MTTKTRIATTVEIDLPDAYRNCHSALEVRHEEDALCWFWAYPHLLLWPRPVLWLYTPVVGNKRWPGDLWGIDTAGDLLIIECKQCRRCDDPFIDFLYYHRAGRSEMSGAEWLVKFQRHLAAELRFANATQERPPGRTDGILPCSNRRQHIRRRPQLALMIDACIRSPEYRESVMRCLHVRSERDDPPPYYIALMVTSDSTVPLLTAKASESGRALQQKAGEKHVRVVGVIAKPVSPDRLRVSAKLHRLQ